jgi:hypothetical protein
MMLRDGQVFIDFAAKKRVRDRLQLPSDDCTGSRQEKFDV